MRKKLKAAIAFLLLTVNTVSLTGCMLDNREPDELVYALNIGIDKGVDNPVRLTVQFPTYKGGGGGGGGGGIEKKGGGSQGGDEEKGIVGNTVVITMEAPSILEAFNLINTSASRTISISHAIQLVFSEELAKEGLGRYLDALARFRDTRRNMYVIICKGSAEEFVRSTDTLIGESLSKAMELSISQSNGIGYFPQVSFHNFYNGALSSYEQSYAIYAGLNDLKKLKPEDGSGSPSPRTGENLLPDELERKGDLKREFLGTTVFDGDKMVGTLGSYETRYLLMVNNRFKTGIFTLNDPDVPDETVVLDTRLGRPTKISARIQSGTPVIDVKVNVEADLSAVQSRIPYEEPLQVNKLNTLFAGYIKKGIDQVILRTQKEFKSDVFGFGKKVVRNFFTTQDFDNYNWLARYPNAKVNVSVVANIRRSGLLIESSPIRSTAGNPSKTTGRR